MQTWRNEINPIGCNMHEPLPQEMRISDRSTDVLGLVWLGSLMVILMIALIGISSIAGESGPSKPAVASSSDGELECIKTPRIAADGAGFKNDRAQVARRARLSHLLRGFSLFSGRSVTRPST